MARPTQRGYKKWMPHNLEVIKKQSKYFIDGIKKRKLVSILRGVVSSMANYISTADIPEYSGHLRDATGVALYVDGALNHFVPTISSSSRPQSSGFHYRNEYGINGVEYLKNTVNDATTDFSDGIWIVLFSAVPYAYFLNYPQLVSNLSKVQGGFFNNISEEFIQKILTGLEPLKAENTPNVQPRYLDLP